MIVLFCLIRFIGLSSFWFHSVVCLSIQPCPYYSSVFTICFERSGSISTPFFPERLTFVSSFLCFDCLISCSCRFAMSTAFGTWRWRAMRASSGTCAYRRSSWRWYDRRSRSRLVSCGRQHVRRRGRGGRMKYIMWKEVKWWLEYVLRKSK